MTVSTLLSVALGASVVLAGAPSSYAPSSNPKWNLKSFKSLVAFGDSYTDDSRLSYFISNNGSAPPVGWVDPANYNSADGGRPWPQYVKQYTGANIYNYAVSGAVCSNDITPRYLAAISGDFPDIKHYEVAAYVADSKFKEADGSNFLTIPVDNTVYSMWIGTNDLGVGAFLTDEQVKPNTLVNYLDCVYNQIQRIYDNGGRYFVLQNVAPLQLAPLYGLPGQGGVGANGYWPNKPSNITQISDRMQEQVALVNAVYQYRTPFAVEVNKRFPGSHFALMDMYGLFTDIHNNPARYLNGTAPLNVTGFINHCDLNRANCVRQPNPDSYLWFDELHPSEQTERVIAKTFVDVVSGRSTWATYWSS